VRGSQRAVRVARGLRHRESNVSPCASFSQAVKAVKDHVATPPQALQRADGSVRM